MLSPLVEDHQRSPLAEHTDVIVIDGRRYRRWPARIHSAIFEAEARLDWESVRDRPLVHRVAAYVLRRREEAMSEFTRRRRIRETRQEAVRGGGLTLKDADVTLLHTNDPKQRTQRADFEELVSKYVAAVAT